MKKYLFTLAAIASFLIFSQGISKAVSVEVTPNPANVNQTVVGYVNATFTPLIGTNCILEVNYGDSGAWTGLPVCTTVNCAKSFNHSYSSPGLYTITARPRVGACVPPPNPPSPATTNINILCPALSITSPTVLPQGAVGTPYSYQVQANGGAPPYSHAIISGALPPGLSINASGLISGTPSTPGTYNFRLQVADSCSSGTQIVHRSFTLLVVTAPCPTLNILSPAVLTAGTAGQSYTYQLMTSGGVAPLMFALSSGTLPPGLNINGSGAISGVPTTPGTYSFTVSAEDSCTSGSQLVQKAFTINIAPAPCPALSITSAAILPAGTAGQPYSYQAQSSGGQPPVILSLSSGELPPGLNMNAAGIISGTPGAAGTYNFTVSANDNCAAGIQQAQKNFTIVIDPPPIGPIQVTVIPPSLQIAQNSAWTQNVQYSFTGSSNAPAVTLESDKGIFTAAGTVIGENNNPLSVMLDNGAGRVSEVLNIPVAISQRAAQLGTARITYSRIFSHALVQVTARLEITVTTGAAADFKITRLQLYFDNHRGEITVRRNQPSLRAYADIHFSGSGLLTGYWEVDGRILQYVNRHLAYGQSLTLASPEVPSLPTFSPGTHVVRLVITSLLGDIPLPEAIYFVTVDKSGEAQTIGLVMPENSGEIGYEPYTFGWRQEPWANTYLVEFYGEDSEKNIFAAFTRKNIYLLPPAILTKVFAAGVTYQWRVRAYDAQGKVVGESAMNSFTFAE